MKYHNLACSSCLIFLDVISFQYWSSWHFASCTLDKHISNKTHLVCDYQNIRLIYDISQQPAVKTLFVTSIHCNSVEVVINEALDITSSLDIDEEVLENTPMDWRWRKELRITNLCLDWFKNDLSWFKSNKGPCCHIMYKFLFSWNKRSILFPIIWSILLYKV